MIAVELRRFGAQTWETVATARTLAELRTGTATWTIRPAHGDTVRVKDALFVADAAGRLHRARRPSGLPTESDWSRFGADLIVSTAKRNGVSSDFLARCALALARRSIELCSVYNDERRAALLAFWSPLLDGAVDYLDFAVNDDAIRALQKRALDMRHSLDGAEIVASAIGACFDGSEPNAADADHAEYVAYACARTSGMDGNAITRKLIPYEVLLCALAGVTPPNTLDR